MKGCHNAIFFKKVGERLAQKNKWNELPFECKESYEKNRAEWQN
jgi:hypothetical protein